MGAVGDRELELQVRERMPDDWRLVQTDTRDGRTIWVLKGDGLVVTYDSLNAVQSRIEYHYDKEAAKEAFGVE